MPSSVVLYAEEMTDKPSRPSAEADARFPSTEDRRRAMVAGLTYTSRNLSSPASLSQSSPALRDGTAEGDSFSGLVLMNTQLHGSHQRTYDAVFQHPLARNLEWLEVRSMLVALADLVEQDGDVLKVTRNSRTLVLRRPYRKGMRDIEELMKVRHFLQQSEAALGDPVANGVHLLVVIDHRLARIYRAEIQGSVPQRITPYDPGGFGRHLHYVQDDSNGQRKPERKSFYEAIAKTLLGAQKILVLGSGTGASSAMGHLLAELERNHRGVAKHIVGASVVNEQHLTENQLLAKAREFYATSA
jgi:hypothetical protein